MNQGKYINILTTSASSQRDTMCSLESTDYLYIYAFIVEAEELHFKQKSPWIRLECKLCMRKIQNITWKCVFRWLVLEQCEPFGKVRSKMVWFDLETALAFMSSIYFEYFFDFLEQWFPKWGQGPTGSPQKHFKDSPKIDYNNKSGILNGVLNELPVYF